MEAIRARHSVRSYTDKPIEEEKLAELRRLVAECNSEGNLNIQLVVDSPKAFGSKLVHYGKFSGVRNYFALIGPKGDDLDEKLGYYGQRLVLAAQTMGLNTCWVGQTYRKDPDSLQIGKGEKLRCVIPLGYGTTQGASHKVKPAEKVSNVAGDSPEWFRSGVEAALLAPTALNQQKFTLELVGDNRVRAKAGWGILSKMEMTFAMVDLGIVKYNFEVGAGRENFEWA